MIINNITNDFNKNLTQLKKKKIITNLIKEKKKKKLKTTKKIFFSVTNSNTLKKKVFFNLIQKLKFAKYIVINNLNNYNVLSKNIDLELNAKLINNAQARLLKLPFSGTTKLVNFTNLIDLKTKINLLNLHKNNFRIVCVNLNQNFYLLKKIQNSFFVNFISKKDFTKKTLIPTFLNLTLIFNKKLQNLIFLTLKYFNFYNLKLKNNLNSN